jgi:hypothetical protein
VRFLASVLVYTALTAIIGREVLANLSTAVANDAGDPLLTAAILHWNAHQVPWTEAWWQLPIFYPTRDTMAFSEHLLGLSAIAAPLAWLTGDPLVTYNLTTLLTFALSATTMYLLVYRLTGSAPGAFIAGLAFGFAPFRISQLPHIQMLASFWAPLALLGLHAFVESGRTRWLVLYGAAWALQSAANGYALVFFSLLVGFWVLWFVVARGRWRELVSIAAATVVAALPLAPILYTYVTVHERHGFFRSLDEIVAFGADVAAVLCAPAPLTFWGWVRVACRPEGELFPGVALFVLCVAALAGVLGLILGVPAPPSSRVVTFIRRLLFVVAAVYAAVIVSVLAGGPWRIDWGFLRVSAGTIRKPLIVMSVALIAALVLSPGVRAAARRSSTTGFYLLAALVTWLFALGPTITVMGVPTETSGPFAWLMVLPGADGLRVPARFWLMSAICLAVAAGLFVADLLARRSRTTVAVALLLIGTAVAADGWVDKIAAPPAPPGAPDAQALAGQVVLQLPVADYPDLAAQWRAITGGWTSVNGYSGFGPSHYAALKTAMRFEEDALFTRFQRDHDLHVIVTKSESRLVALVERQPGMVRTAENDWAFQYRLPRRAALASPTPGAAVPIASASTGCDGGTVGLALDRDETTRWICPPIGVPQQLRIDLGRPVAVGAYVQGMGRFSWEAPRYLVIETSVDGRSWREVWNGSVLEQVIDGALRDPRSLRIVVPFAPHAARYLRIRAEHNEAGFHWTIAEAEVRAP